MNLYEIENMKKDRVTFLVSRVLRSTKNSCNINLESLSFFDIETLSRDKSVLYYDTWVFENRTDRDEKRT